MLQIKKTWRRFFFFYRWTHKRIKSYFRKQLRARASTWIILKEKIQRTMFLLRHVEKKKNERASFRRKRNLDFAFPVFFFFFCSCKSPTVYNLPSSFAQTSVQYVWRLLHCALPTSYCFGKTERHIICVYIIYIYTWLIIIIYT